MEEILILKQQLIEKEAEIKALKTDAEAKAAEFSASVKTSDEDNAKALKIKSEEVKALNKKITEFTEAQQKADVTALVETAVKSGRVLPKNKDTQIEIGMALLSADFADGEDNPYTKWADQMKTGPKVIKFDEKSASGSADGEDDERTQKEIDYDDGVKIGQEAMKAREGK